MAEFQTRLMPEDIASFLEICTVPSDTSWVGVSIVLQGGVGARLGGQQNGHLSAGVEAWQRSFILKTFTQD